MSVPPPDAFSEDAALRKSNAEDASTFQTLSARRIETVGESHAPVTRNGIACVERCGSSVTVTSLPHEPAPLAMLTTACVPESASGAVRAPKKLLAAPVQKSEIRAVSHAAYDVLSSVRFWMVALVPRST